MKQRVADLHVLIGSFLAAVVPDPAGNGEVRLENLLEMLNSGNEFWLKRLSGFDFDGCKLAAFGNQQIHFIIDFMQISS